MIEKYCIRCGKKFIAKNNQTKYCSTQCKDKKFIKNCNYCNISFFAYKKQVYCSDFCKKKHSIVKKEEKSKSIKEKRELYKKSEERILKIKLMNEKIRKTNLEKYGVEHPSQNKLIVEKTKKTNLEKFGTEWYTQTKEYLEKTKKTNLEKYGVNYYIQSDDCKEKTKKTNLKKYNNECYHKSKYFDNKFNTIEGNPNYKHILNLKNFNKDFVEKTFVKDNKFCMSEFCNYFNIKSLSNGYLIKKRFNINYPNKYKKYNSQETLQDFIINTYNSKVIINRKLLLKNLELDIYLPLKNIALEFDGIYFHSYGKHKIFEKFNNYDKEDSNYHVNKTNLCEEKEVRLFHIFENEWINPTKQEIWKSMIKNSLGLINDKIYARKCEIKEINDKKCITFLENNHLQGYKSSSINIGLYYNNELVSIMTFGKSRFNKNYDYELLRFCNKINTNVVGSFSKLLSHFKSNYQGKIISYGNRRWCSTLNNVYEKNGGKLIKISKPNYFYFKHRTYLLESRLKYQKHKLKNILENFDSNLTETENMYNNDYRKIYDCGNLVYEL